LLFRRWPHGAGTTPEINLKTPLTLYVHSSGGSLAGAVSLRAAVRDLTAPRRGR
jgi:hypothetical protein